jgi:hypothetical protein
MVDRSVLHKSALTLFQTVSWVGNVHLRPLVGRAGGPKVETGTRKRPSFVSWSKYLSFASIALKLLAVLF